MCDYIPPPMHIGLKRKIKNRDGRVLIYTVKDELIEMENREKAIYLQQLEFAEGHKEYRFAYWILGKKGIFAGKWMFGQCASMMTKEVFEKMLKKATAKGWFAS